MIVDGGDVGSSRLAIKYWFTMTWIGVSNGTPFKLLSSPCVVAVVEHRGIPAAAGLAILAGAQREFRCAAGEPGLRPREAWPRRDFGYGFDEALRGCAAVTIPTQEESDRS